MDVRTFGNTNVACNYRVTMNFQEDLNEYIAILEQRPDFGSDIALRHVVEILKEVKNEKELRKQNEKLVHDLRNPLTIISLHAELIKLEGNISVDTKEACEKIGEAIKKLSEIAAQFIND